MTIKWQYQISAGKRKKKKKVNPWWTFPTVFHSLSKKPTPKNKARQVRGLITKTFQSQYISQKSNLPTIPSGVQIISPFCKWLQDFFWYYRIFYFKNQKPHLVFLFLLKLLINNKSQNHSLTKVTYSLISIQ